MKYINTIKPKKLGVLYIIGLYIITSSFFSCTPEQFIYAKNIQLWNYDSIPMDIYVDGELAVSFNEGRGHGNVYLTSGSYELVAKVDGKEIDKVNVSVAKEIESNKYDKQIWIIGKKKNYALFNVGELYEGDGEIELLEKFIDVNFVEFDCPTYRFYYPNNRLPASLYSTGNPDVYQLIEIPDKYMDKDDLDERLMKYMNLRAVF